MLKHKYSEQIHRRLSWDEHPSAEDPRHALKRMMKSYWHSSYLGGRFCDDAEPTKHESESPDVKGGLRPGQNVEDVESGAMDHLIFGKDRILQRRKARKVKPTSQTADGQPMEQDDFIIDPITNRKVARQPQSGSLKNGEDIPVKTFKDYRSQFANAEVVSKQATSSEQHMMDAWPHFQSDEYVQNSDSREHKHSQSEGFNFEEHHPAVSPRTNKAASAEGESAGFDDLLRYKPFQDSGLDAHPASIEEGLSKDHGDLLRCRTAKDQAHGQFGDLQPPQENINGYEYKSVVADEIASRFENAESRDATQHNPATGETDALRDTEPAHKSADQRGSIRHEGKQLGFREEFVKPEVLRRYRSTVEAVEPGDFPETTVEDLRAKYGAVQLKQYTTVRAAGQEQTLPSSAQGLRERSDQKELAENEPSYNMSEGEPQPPAEALSNDHTVLQKCNGPSLFNEPDGRLSSADEKANLDANHVLAEDYGGSSMSNDSGGKSFYPEKKLSYVEMENGPQEATYQESEGRPVAQDNSVEEDIDPHYDFNGSQCRATEEPKDRAVFGSEASEKANSLGPSLERLASVKQGQGKKSNYREMLESLMNQHEQLSDVHDEEATLAIKSAKAKNQQADVPGRKLTGKYMRDFPEEFEKSWTQTLSSPPADAEISTETEALVESENMDGGLEGAFGRPGPSKIQPALDRHVSAKDTIDQDSPGAQDPRGVETSTQDERGEEIKQYSGVWDAKNKLTEDADGHAAKESSEVCEETKSTTENVPVLYKVLAYDPTMQKINVAETTSLVPDFTSALSPADALLRLSHPTRFFPHFASLEAEGFEIVSGSGDVLVFRKVRPSKPEQVEEISTELASADTKRPAIESPVNPIDMTGRPRVISPASANFASPTGYVKYENLPETEASNLPPPPPRVAYNINLRREEPVYSGPKYRPHDEQKQKKGLGQRLLVGGVWVAGISYGLGVVSEYFTTGGMDGMGPQGL